MTTPTPPMSPMPVPYVNDKVQVVAEYDEQGRCHSIDVRLNYDGISREDLTETIRAAFHPEPAIMDGTFRHRELGSTEVIPMSARNGSRPEPTTSINAPHSRTAR